MILREIDWRDPVEAFLPLRAEPYAQLFHAGAKSTAARWSIITAFPVDMVETHAHGNANPFGQIRERLEDRTMTADNASPRLPFASGAAGYIGYEAARYLDPSMAVSPSPLSLPDVSMAFYDAAVLFSHDGQHAFLTGRCEKAIKKLADVLETGRTPQSARPNRAGQIYGDLSLRSDTTRQDYEACVAHVIDDILDGKYYQTNIAQKLCVSSAEPIDSFGVYQRLLRASDASYAAFLQRRGGDVISNSPERFFSIDVTGDHRRIVTEPIKGTRPRGTTPEQDARLLSELMADEKDRAENIMIADLMRNDLSRICEDGSIIEEAICAPLTLNYVHHLVSRISGILKLNVDMLDIFSALFPCGSITGAPKISAMSAIARYEKSGRGPYCGAIGYIDDRGGADFSVGIRTMMTDKARLNISVPVGGGITLGSDPRSEYEETLAKAKGALTAIGTSTETLS